jgi:hypothetical protein
MGILPTLEALASEHRIAVVISCNACSDSTATIARSANNVTVIESPIAGKAEAINRAELEVSHVFPRLYVDADVRIDVDSFIRLFAALDRPEPVAVRPSEFYDLSDRPTTVRIFYSMRHVIPSSQAWMNAHIEGRGIYGTNEAGRSRFGDFPSLRADDAFFDRMFDSDMKLAVEDAIVELDAPRTTGELWRSLVRVTEANHELQRWLREHNVTEMSVTSNPIRKSPKARLRLFLQSNFASARPSIIVMSLFVMALRKSAEIAAMVHERSGRKPSWR